MGIFKQLFGDKGGEANQEIDLLAENWSTRAQPLQTLVGHEGLPGIVEDILDNETKMLVSDCHEFEQQRGQPLSSWELARLLSRFETGLRSKGLTPRIAKALNKKIRQKITLGR